MKILVAGFQHETNTFSPIAARYEDFERADLWPPLLLGEDMFDGLKGINLPCPGFIEEARHHGHELVPILWCSAEPSGPVEDAAFERIAGMICARVKQEPNVDALYLDLHGAMATQSHQDAEGELLARLRALLGPQCPIVVSLDFHANISPAMFEMADLISVYRTYPHVDMFETGQRAYHYLQRWFAGGLRHKGFRQVPYLIPLSAQCTQQAPNRQLYRFLEHCEAQNGQLGLEMALGFPPADIADAGPAMLAYGADEAQVDGALGKLFSAAMEAEVMYTDELYSPVDAIKLAALNSTNKPVILADVQDNPGAGGTCDTVGILVALYACGVRGAALGVLCDPDAVVKAYEAGEGGYFHATIGDQHHYDGQPFCAEFRVEKLSDGRFPCVGEMYSGAIAEVGPLALLRVQDEQADILLVLCSERFQCVDRSVFAHLGVQVEQLRLLVLKSTVHFRADFEPIAAQIISVVAPGAHPCRLDTLDYQHLRPGVRLGPCGPTTQGG